MSSTFSHHDDRLERVLTEAPRDMAFYLNSGTGLGSQTGPCACTFPCRWWPVQSRATAECGCRSCASACRSGLTSELGPSASAQRDFGNSSDALRSRSSTSCLWPVSPASARNARIYCPSNARSAPSTEPPRPAIPSRMLGPRRAIQILPRLCNRGRLIALGLHGQAMQYSSIRCRAACVWRKSRVLILCESLVPQNCRRPGFVLARDLCLGP